MIVCLIGLFDCASYREFRRSIIVGAVVWYPSWQIIRNKILLFLFWLFRFVYALSICYAIHSYFHSYTIIVLAQSLPQTSSIFSYGFHHYPAIVLELLHSTAL